MTSQANSNQGDKMRNAMIGQLAETPTSELSSTTRGVCTKDVPTARGPRECGERANVTWTASYGGIRVEEGRCTLHNV